MGSFVSRVDVVFPRFFRRTIVTIRACFGLVFGFGVWIGCFRAVQSICTWTDSFGEYDAV